MNNDENKYHFSRKKHNSVDLFRQRISKASNKIDKRISKASNKIDKRISKASNKIDKRFSKVSNKYEKRKFSRKASFITYFNNDTKTNYSKMGFNSSRDESDFDFEGVEKGIKYAILEMKNNCLLEIRRQSFDHLESPRKKQMKAELNEELKNTNISENLKFEDN